MTTSAGAPLDLERTTPVLDAATGLRKLATYPFLVLTWIDADGYPMSAAVEATIDAEAGTATFAAPAGFEPPAATAANRVSLTGSHIRPQPGYGYDERRHVSVWGPVRPGADGSGRVRLEGRSAWGWDEAETHFFEYQERSVRQSRRYFDALSAERGTPVKPRLSLGWLTMRATRLPFLSATIVPVVIGILIAASHGAFSLVPAILTVIGASQPHGPGRSQDGTG